MATNVLIILQKLLSMQMHFTRNENVFPLHCIQSGWISPCYAFSSSLLCLPAPHHVMIKTWIQPCWKFRWSFTTRKGSLLAKLQQEASRNRSIAYGYCGCYVHFFCACRCVWSDVTHSSNTYSFADLSNSIVMRRCSQTAFPVRTLPIKALR